VKKQWKQLVSSEVVEKQWVVSVKYSVEITHIYKQKRLTKVNWFLVSCFSKEKEHVVMGICSVSDPNKDNFDIPFILIDHS